VADFVRTETDEHGVATLSWDRPPANALVPQLWSELGDAARALSADEHVAAVVLWGGSTVVGAGADVNELAGMTPKQAQDVGTGLQADFAALAAIPKPTIAAVAGYALGGGCELALTADFRFAADNAKLGQPEILLGIIPGAGGTQRLPRIVGVSKAKEMIYSGRLYTAEEGRAMGLVDEIVAADGLYDRAIEAARGYAQGPYALQLAKRAIDEGAGMSSDDGLRHETALFAAAFATEDRHTGMASYLEHGPGQATFARR
jgi:enoyl-CoA hydratase/carnithine racemase